MINELPLSKLTGYRDIATRICPKGVTPNVLIGGPVPGFPTVREPHRSEGNRGIDAFGNDKL